MSEDMLSKKIGQFEGHAKFRNRLLNINVLHFSYHGQTSESDYIQNRSGISFTYSRLVYSTNTQDEIRF